MTKTKKKSPGKYWICDPCAISKGWIMPKGCVTVIKGLCAWCKSKKETTLIPTCDFTIPGVRHQIWD